jgi:DNA-binding MarR family transcriptional regulator
MSRSPPARRKDNSTDPAGEFAMDVPEQLFYLLFQLVRRRDAQFDAEIAPLGLTLAGWRTLAVVRRIAVCSMKDLSRYSTIDRTTLTRSVDQLVEDGLIERRVPASDRRLVVLSLTDAGEQLYAEAVGKLVALNRRLLVDIDASAQRQLARAMETVLGNLITDPTEAAAVIRFGRAGPPEG